MSSWYESSSRGRALAGPDVISRCDGCGLLRVMDGGWMMMTSGLRPLTVLVVVLVLMMIRKIVRVYMLRPI